MMGATKINLSAEERWMSSIAGVLLTLYGLKRRSSTGAMIAASGAALLWRGTSGFSPVYAAIGRSSAPDTRAALGGSRGVHVVESVTINRPTNELYEQWRSLESLPRFMSHLDSVTVTDGRSHWKAKGPAGQVVEWDAEIINDIPNKLISWRTVNGAQVISAGSVKFVPVHEGRETQLEVNLQYQPPAGKAGAAVAWLLGKEPGQTIHQDLRRFKALMEGGEVPTVAGQPRGQQSALNYD